VKTQFSLFSSIVFSIHPNLAAEIQQLIDRLMPLVTNLEMKQLLTLVRGPSSIDN
jgi:hypothetical protein